MIAIAITLWLSLAIETEDVKLKAYFRPPEHKEHNYPQFPTGDNEVESYQEELTGESLYEAEYALIADRSPGIQTVAFACWVRCCLDHQSRPSPHFAAGR